MLCIVFYLNLRLKYVVKYFIIFFCKYSQVPVDIKKWWGYPHNGYPTDMSMDTGQIFIQRVAYGEVTTCTLSVLLTSLLLCIWLNLKWVFTVISFRCLYFNLLCNP